MFEKFIKENIEKDLNNFVSFVELRRRYLSFCKFNNIEPVSRHKFGFDLSKHDVGMPGQKYLDHRLKHGRHNVRLLPCKY